MRVLIVEDDFACRRLLQRCLAPYGECDVAVNGQEAIEAVQVAMDENQMYDLICLDIMMPQMNGHDTLNNIRQMEAARGIHLGQGVKIIMTTTCGDGKNIMQSFTEGCEAYIVKPIAKAKFLEEVERLGLISVGVS